VKHRACEYPTAEPSVTNPGGDCRKPGTWAAPLGTSGRFLALCEQHAQHRADAVPIEQIDEP
jgi:hypothetical protein